MLFFGFFMFGWRLGELIYGEDVLNKEVRLADCVVCRKPDCEKVICPYRDWPFNEAKPVFLGQDGHCSRIKKRGK